MLLVLSSKYTQDKKCLLCIYAHQFYFICYFPLNIETQLQKSSSKHEHNRESMSFNFKSNTTCNSVSNSQAGHLTKDKSYLSYSVNSLL